MKGLIYAGYQARQRGAFSVFGTLAPPWKGSWLKWSRAGFSRMKPGWGKEGNEPVVELSGGEGQAFWPGVGTALVGEDSAEKSGC